MRLTNAPSTHKSAVAMARFLVSGLLAASCVLLGACNTSLLAPTKSAPVPTRVHLGYQRTASGH